MSKWTHAICNECWNARNPEREPYRVTEAEEEKCCFCGLETLSGIYTREDPSKTLCKGVHHE